MTSGGEMRFKRGVVRHDHKAVRHHSRLASSEVKQYSPCRSAGPPPAQCTTAHSDIPAGPRSTQARAGAAGAQSGTDRGTNHQRRHKL